jgi:hypothetical protein
MIFDITFCVARRCNQSADCYRHFSNHTLGDELVSMADFYTEDIIDCNYFESIRLQEQARKIENGKKRRR